MIYDANLIKYVRKQCVLLVLDAGPDLPGLHVLGTGRVRVSLPVRGQGRYI